MSNAIFPTLAGRSYSAHKNPIWSTQVRSSASGREFALGKRTYPQWRFKIPFEVLRAAGSFTEYQQLVGFINARRGRFDDFLYLDPRDYLVSDQAFGTGDGVTTSFELVRSLGGFVEPVGAAMAATIKVAGVTTGVTWNADLNKVIFAAPPAAAAALTWSGDFYFRCRFLQDETTIEQFMCDLHTAKSIEFKTFRT